MFNLMLPEVLPTLAEAGGRGWLMPPAHSTHVPYVDTAMDWINAITVFFFIGIIAAMVIFIVKYRRRSVTDRASSQMGHNTALELSWTLPPVVIVIFIFYLGFTGYMELSKNPGDAYEVQVTGQKWSWTFTHPNGRQDTNELHVPAGTNVRLVTNSRDVIHSVFIPAFRVKKDAVPGRYNRLWFKADAPTPGADYELPQDPAVLAKLSRAWVERSARAAVDPKQKEPQAIEAAFAALKTEEHKKYAEQELAAIAADGGHVLYCTEFCGTNHSLMLAKVIVHKQGWTAPELKIDFSNPIEAGRQVFAMKGCAGCHQVQKGGARLVGPSFGEGIFGKTERLVGGATVQVDENYIRESIVNPNLKVVEGYGPVMPVIPMTDTEIDAVIAYLKSLK